MITEEKLLSEPNYLLNQIKKVTQQALTIGALQPIETKYEQVDDFNIPFLVRVITNLARKDEDTQTRKLEKKAKNQKFNPFLPYDRDLFVSNIFPTHLAVLNKFNVVENHLLIITKEFVDQESLINAQDFSALSACLKQINGLAFYNSGKIAGASVQHKHLQIVPFPLAPFLEQTPLDQALLQLEIKEKFFQLPQFPFSHYFAKINDHYSGDFLSETYLQLLEKLNIKIENNKPNQAYNLLLTRNWMLIVPRKAESYQGISINSLGFAGALLVRNEEQLALLKQKQPINILSKITFV